MVTKLLKFWLWAVMLVGAAFLGGCATQIEVQPSQTTRSSVPFDSYKRVVLVKSKIADKYADEPANIKAVNKIDEILTERMNFVFNNLETATTEETTQYQGKNSQAKQTLLIKPLVKQVKFIGGAARFWAGAMAGSSLVVMDVTYEDATTGKVIAQAGFLRKGGAMSGAWSMGAVDNQMLDNVAQDVVNYTIANR